MPNFNYLKKNKGFTLIELLVVISVISLLSSITLNNLFGAREKARIAAARATLNNAFLGAVLCVDSGEELINNPGDTCGPSGAFFLAPQGQPLCAGSEDVWPDITEFGFTYQICMSTTENNQLVMMTTNGFQDIVCSYNYNSPKISNESRCDIYQNGLVGTCVDYEGGGSANVCRIGHGDCPVGETCEQLVL